MIAAAAYELSVRLGGALVLDRVDLEVGAGEVVALVGPNGAGKSTLLGALAGDVRPQSGRVEIEGQPVAAVPARELARRRAVLLQQVTLSFPFNVGDVVRMGRSPWVGTDHEDDDEQAVLDAMTVTDVVHLVDRVFTTLSGGERARVALARVLAQRTPVLLLDEPTAALDIRHQEQVLRVATQRAEHDTAVVVVLHDLGLAAAYADRVVVLDRGGVAADVKPGELTEELLSRVYAHPVEVLAHPRSGASIIQPIR